jgi:hypothetical protein
MRFHGHEDRTGGIFVEICTAHTDPGHLDFDLTGSGTWGIRNVDNPDIFSTVPDCCSHALFSFLIDRE